MSYTDAPIPNNADAKFAAWRLGIEERLARLERFGPVDDRALTVTPANIVIGGFSMGSTAASFEDGWAFTALRAIHDCVVIQATVATPASTTAQVRLRNPDTSDVTSAISIGASTTGVATFRWIHGISPILIEQPRFQIIIQVKRTAGSGTVSLLAPGLAVQVPSSSVDGADTTGGGSFA